MVRVVPALFTALAGLALVVPASAVASAASATSTAGASGPTLTLEPAPGVTVTVDGRPYAGDLVTAPASGGVAVVNRVDFEQYVEGIAEMPSSWPASALQAQAVAARTYALWTVLTHPPGAGGGQICATDACQVYAGLSKAAGPHGSAWVAAAQATRGVVLQYGGRIIESLYGSSDGGQTLYGGVPWLPSVSDAQDSLAPEHRWSWSVPLAQMAAVLEVPAGRALVGLVSSTHAITETLRDAGGSTSTLALPPDAFHSIVDSRMAAPAGLDLPLPSYRYSVSTYGDSVRIDGWGDGNGLGLSQYGALGKAEAGWSAGEILANYYAGTTAAPLPAGQMPARISVTLASGAASVVVGATGPARILDGSGHTLVTTTGPGAWSVAATAGGVSLAPTSAVPVAPPPASDNAAPVTPRMSAPASPVAGSIPASTSTTVPTTDAPSAGRPAAGATGSAGSGAPAPASSEPSVAASETGSARPARGEGGPGPLLLLVAVGAALGTASLAGRRRGRKLLRSLRPGQRAT